MFAKAFVVGALAVLAAAQSSTLSFTRVPNPVTVNQQIAITYATANPNEPVTILLRKGVCATAIMSLRRGTDPFSRTRTT
jgi:hypothetical protein